MTLSFENVKFALWDLLFFSKQLLNLERWWNRALPTVFGSYQKHVIWKFLRNLKRHRANSIIGYNGCLWVHSVSDMRQKLVWINIEDFYLEIEAWNCEAQERGCRKNKAHTWPSPALGAYKRLHNNFRVQKSRCQCSTPCAAHGGGRSTEQSFGDTYSPHLCPRAQKAGDVYLTARPHKWSIWIPAWA